MEPHTSNPTPPAPVPPSDSVEHSEIEAAQRHTAADPVPPDVSPPTSSAANDAAAAARLHQRERTLRYWRRPLILAGMVLILLALSWWEDSRRPTRPVRPDVRLATPAPGASALATDPALMETLARLGNTLARRDAEALADLMHPDGVLVTSYGGGLPDLGYAATVTELASFSRDVLDGAQLSLLGWRRNGRGHVVVLSDGWQRQPLQPSGAAARGASALELTPLCAIGLDSKDGSWHVRWLLPDTSGVLARQARTLVWQPMPS
ncbi:MAG: hypothetical protein ACRDJN_11865 [Chloroflexota bacterium]